jgi:hypothetical protein
VQILHTTSLWLTIASILAMQSFGILSGRCNNYVLIMTNGPLVCIIINLICIICLPRHVDLNISKKSGLHLFFPELPVTSGKSGIVNVIISLQ